MSRTIPVAISVATALAAAQPLLAMKSEQVPDELKGIGIEEELGGKVAADVRFRNEIGEDVRLKDYLGKGHPVIVTLNYLNCPMLCPMELEGLVTGLRGVDWSPGADYEIVTISIDPRDKPTAARAAKKKYVRQLERPSAVPGWHFLTGDEASIRAVTDSVGFRYRFIPESGEFSHTAAVVLLSDEGKIMRYLYGVEFLPETLRLGLLEASQGKLGNTLDKIILYCHRYDPSTHEYGPAAMNIMRLGGGLTFVILAALLLTLWTRERRSAKVTGK